MNKCTCSEPNSHYSLIFMDCNMPILDGYKATMEIRKLDIRPSLTIVALTANTASNQLVKKCIDHGMNGCLTKPVESAELSKWVKSSMYTKDH